jgi:hypothetical protein
MVKIKGALIRLVVVAILLDLSICEYSECPMNQVCD